MLAIATAVFAIVVVYGFACVDGFGGNLLAEIAGVAAGVVVAVLVVEAIMDRRRGEEWSLVRDQLATSARGLAQMAALELHVALPQEVRSAIPSPAVLPSGGHTAMLDQLAGELDAYVKTYDDNTAHMEPIRLHESLSPVVWRIRSELGPRVMASGEPGLVHTFGALDEVLGAWDLARYRLEGAHDEMLPTLWGNAADFARAFANFIRAAEGRSSD
jgi:hypothetical protein